ncbi:MAG: hypothetical protein ACOCNB_04580 [Acetivibrio ethanolgignens]
MSDYKRFVSYLYCYDNGIKKNNIGYARVETRRGQCKITIHIKLLSLSHAVLDTYLFYRKGNRIIGLPLCPLNVKNSVGDCQAVISSDKVAGSDLPFSMISGIIITVSKSRLLGTEWDDLPILPSVFQTEAEANGYENVSAADLTLVAEPTAEAAMEESAVEEPVVENPTVEEPAAEEPAPEEPLAVKTALSENPASTPAAPPSIESSITNYLLIDPAYIDHLSPEYNGLKQNSFLLHGYDSYRHLILAKWLVSSPKLTAADTVTSENSPELEDLDIFYQLGVPGIYSDREKSIAEKFGFAEFKTTKNTPLRYGDFGYWLVPVNF